MLSLNGVYANGEKFHLQTEDAEGKSVSAYERRGCGGKGGVSRRGADGRLWV